MLFPPSAGIEISSWMPMRKDFADNRKRLRRTMWNIELTFITRT